MYTLKPDEKQLEHLAPYKSKNGFDFWTTTVKPHNNVTIMVAPSQQELFLQFLLDEKIHYDIVIDDAEKWVTAKYILSKVIVMFVIINKSLTGIAAFTQTSFWNVIS